MFSNRQTTTGIASNNRSKSLTGAEAKSIRLIFALLAGAAALLVWWFYPPQAFQVFDGIRTGFILDTDHSAPPTAFGATKVTKFQDFGREKFYDADKELCPMPFQRGAGK